MAGRFSALEADRPYQHAAIFERESTTGTDRLRIGGGQSPVGLLVALARVLREPLFVLAEIRVPLATDDEARYESEAMGHAEVASFFEDFGSLFARDARASPWIGSTCGDGLLVLDEHDLIYAYGPLGVIEDVLLVRGFSGGSTELFYPHEHNYDRTLDGEERRLVESVDWRRVIPTDDPGD